MDERLYRGETLSVSVWKSYTVGSYDFYLGYGGEKEQDRYLDTGHFHLTESIADKVFPRYCCLRPRSCCT